MSKNKKIAVLVPAYNAGNVIHETLDSLVAQTYPYWECFCMNDGSTDNTSDVIKRYVENDTRFHSFLQQNSGLTKTLNVLLNKVSDDFDYIYFLDSDDCIHPQTFEMMVNIQQNTRVDIVEGSMLRFMDEKPLVYYDKLNINELSVQVLTDMTAFLLKRTRKGIGGTWINKQKLYVWSKIKSVRFNEQLSYEDDYFYNSQVHTIIRSKAVINYPFYYYRVNPKSMTQSINYQKYQQACTARIYATYDYFIKGNRVPSEILKEFKTDMANDAYRMIGLKPVRRCRDKKMRRQLYINACRTFKDMRSNDIINVSGLGWNKRLIFWSFSVGYYPLTRFLLLFK